MNNSTVAGEMEVDYTRLRTSCGLIDHRGAGLFQVSGPGAVDFLDSVCTRSVAFLLDGRTLCALLLDHDGGLISEVLLSCDGDAYTLRVWQAQRDAAWSHLSHMAAGRDGVELRDRSHSVAIFGVEGPRSQLVLQHFLDTPIGELAYKHVLTTEWEGAPLVISRTGVTAEFGYELRTRVDLGEALHRCLADLGATPVGLAAVNVCRLESRFVNYEDESPRPGASPWELGVQSMVDFNHDFVGRQAILDLWRSGTFREPVCFTTQARSLRTGDPVRMLDREIGRMSHALFSPGLVKTVGVVHLDREFAAAGLDLRVQVGDEEVAITTCSAPFLLPTSLKGRQT